MAISFSGNIIQLAKQEVFKNKDGVAFVIDVYQQQPTAHWDGEEDFSDFIERVGESAYGTHGYEITLQDSGMRFYSDFQTMWDVEACLDNAYQDILYYEGEE